MTRARKESALHLALLVLVQWISLAVVILNATALYLLRSSQHRGLVNTHSSPIDYMLLILSCTSFAGSTVFLLLHLQLHFRIADDHSFSPPKSLIATEVIVSVISIALWTVATSVILTHSQEPSSACRFTNSLYIQGHNNVCQLFDTTIMLAFAAVGSWVLVLLATLFFLIRSPIPPTTIFTIEAPPQRFSQPMLVSQPENVYLQSSQQPSRPYYLGHYSNKVRPIIDEQEDQNSQRVIVTEEITENTSQHNKRRASVDVLGMSSCDSAILGYTMNHIEDEVEEDELGSTTISPSYYYYYQPHHMPLSSPSNNNSSVTHNTTSNATAESSYYSTRCQIPQTESQRTFQSLSTIDSIYTGYQPIQFDLPIIRVGMLSHIDASFLQMKVEEERQ